MRAHRVLETCLYVDDLEAAEAFYRDVLGLELRSAKPGRHLFFRCGGQMVLLFDPVRASSPGSEVPPHGAHGPGHLAFAMAPEERTGWKEHLARHGVEVEQEVQWPGGGCSLYFRDPAGNSLELASPSLWFDAPG